MKEEERDRLRASMPGDARRCGRCGGPAVVGRADEKGFWVFYLCFACSVLPDRDQWPRVPHGE